jgi:chemotaxis protein histidine kinase CheA
VKDRESLRLDGDDPKRENESYLVLETHGELYAVRWPLVRQVGMLLQTEIDASQVPSQVQRDGLALPVYYLWELVGLKPPLEKPMEIPAVFLEEEDRRAVLVPERILWKQEATLQELPQWLDRAPIVMGAIVLGSGVVVIVLGPIGNNSVCEKAACTTERSS